MELRNELEVDPITKDVQDMVLVVEINKEVVKDTFGIKHEVESRSKRSAK